jgi:hypothetical protein
MTVVDDRACFGRRAMPFFADIEPGEVHRRCIGPQHLTKAPTAGVPDNEHNLLQC